MSVIQGILIVAILLMLFISLRGRRSKVGQAWRKVGYLVLLLLMMVAVVIPSVTTRIAHSVGVGRGADLLLYITVIAFAFSATSGYLRRQDQRTEIHRLARQVALLEARTRYRNRME